MYGLINKHKGPINYHKIKLIGKLETPKIKEEEDPRVGKKNKKKEVVSLLDTCRKIGI